MMASDWRTMRNALVRDASDKGVDGLPATELLSYGVTVPCDVSAPQG